MGLFNFLFSPEKQIEREGKLLEKDNRTVAIVTAYSDWDSSESVTDSEGNSSIRSFMMEDADFKFKINGEWYEYSISPREGKGDFIVGEQWIVKYSPKLKAIIGFDCRLRPDIPYRIKEE